MMKEILVLIANFLLFIHAAAGQDSYQDSKNMIGENIAGYRGCKYHITQYLGKFSCQNCRIIAIERSRIINERYDFCGSEIVQLIDRYVDTLYFKEIYKNSKFIRYLLYSDNEDKNILDKQYTWECTSNEGESIGNGSILTEVGLSRMDAMLDSLDGSRAMKIEQTLLYALDEIESPLILPLYPPKVQHGLLAVADDSRTAVMLYDLNNGRRIYEKIISDTLLNGIIKKNEKRFEGYSSKGKLRSVALSDDGTIRLIGNVPIVMLDDQGSEAIINTPYYCSIDYTSSETKITRLKDICEKFYNYSYMNSLIFGDSVWITSPTWKISETSYDSLYTVTIINTRNCRLNEYGKVGEIYKNLDIGENFLTGHIAIVDEKIYTTQTLTPWIVCESTSMCILKNDSLFQVQHSESKKAGIELSKIGLSTFERSGHYQPLIYTISMFSLGNSYLVHVYYIPSKSRADCTVYNVRNGKMSCFPDIKYGGYSRESDSSFIAISSSSKGQILYRYEVKE